MKKTAALLGLFLTLSLGGCGLRPIYGSVGDNASATASDLNNISIANIPDRDGQILRNFLVDRLYGKNRPQQPQYKLQVKIRFTEEDLGILANATSTRSLLNMYGDYSLTGPDNKVLLSGTARSIASFDKLSQIYGTEAAREDAHQRTLREVGEQIVNRLGLYFAERK